MNLQLKNIEKSYDKPVLKGISYTFETGKFYVIKGVSGCGKTSLLNIIGGIDTEYQGNLIWEGGTGYVFQRSLLLSGLSLKENLRLIRNDDERIGALAEQVSIASLLDRLPSEVSGGERQRVSVVRALLNNPQLLLADEPTASLDGENSRLIADLLNGLKQEERILIVATHEHYFDEMADEILELDYGVLNLIKKRKEGKAEASAACSVQSSHDSDKKAEKRKPLVRYAIKRRSKQRRIRSILPLAAAFLLILIAGLFQKNFSREARRLEAEQYPMDMVVIPRTLLDNFPYKDWLRVYDYLCMTDGKITARYLPSKNASVLSVEGMLDYGHFPENDHEVIITKAAASSLFPDESLAFVVGLTFSFGGKRFIVAAVVNEKKQLFREHMDRDVYYHQLEEKIIFIPYDVLRTMTDPAVPLWDTLDVMCAADGVGKDPERQQLLEKAMVFRTEFAHEVIEEKLFPNAYYQLIAFQQKEVDGIMREFYLIILLIGLLLCLYMAAIIRTELFYRREELGYLQIFGLTRAEVARMLTGEYAVRLSAALLLALVSSTLLMLFYWLIMGGALVFSLKALLFCMILSVLYLSFAFFTVKSFLGQKIIVLITKN